MISKSVNLGKNVVIKEGVIIGENVILEDEVYLDYGCIIRDNVQIKKGSFIGARCIIGEYLFDFYKKRLNSENNLIIGENAIIRSENVIYGNTTIGDNFQSGHKVTIRENTQIANNVKISTLSDIQHKCSIGNYVSIHSNCFVGEETVIKDYVWLFPNVTITNDPTPPSNELLGVTIEKFAVICAKSLILPGIHIEENALVAAGSIVTKNVPKETLAIGNPAKAIHSIRDIKNKVTGENAYPWMEKFTRGMPWEEVGYDLWSKNRVIGEVEGNNV
jgi:acetyltransferase-like isoleucine patch superfamily enzyme